MGAANSQRIMHEGGSLTIPNDDLFLDSPQKQKRVQKWINHSSSTSSDLGEHSANGTTHVKNRLSLSQFPDFLTSLENDESSVVTCYNSLNSVEYVSKSVGAMLGVDLSKELSQVDFPVAPRRGAIYFRRHVNGSLVQFQNTMLSRLPTGKVFTMDRLMVPTPADESSIALLVQQNGDITFCQGATVASKRDFFDQNLFRLMTSRDTAFLTEALSIALKGCSGSMGSSGSSSVISKLTTKQIDVMLDFSPCVPCNNGYAVVTISLLSGARISVEDFVGCSSGGQQHRRSSFSTQNSLDSDSVQSFSSMLSPQSSSAPLSSYSQQGQYWQKLLGKLSAEVKYLRDFRDKSLLPMCSVSSDGIVLWANDAMIEMMGFTGFREDYIGSEISSYHEDKRLLHEMSEKVLGGQTLVDFPFNIIRKDGKVVNVTCNSNAKFDIHGVFSHTRCIVQDMTGRNLLRQDMEELMKKQLSAEQKEKAAITASRTKSDFLAVMSHEIRTPINGVIGATSLLAVTNLNDEQRDYVNTISDSADILLSLVHNILDISKIEKGKFELDKVSLRLADLVRKCGDMMRNRALEKGIAMVTDIGEELDDQDVWHHGDPTRLNQVLLNFLSNAVKFTHSGSVECRLIKLPPNKVGASSVLSQDVYDSGDSSRTGTQEDGTCDESIRRSCFENSFRRSGRERPSLLLTVPAGATCSYFTSSAHTPVAGSSYDIIRIEVVDTGCGIEDCSNLFSPFMQATPSVHQKYGGTGLGLNISKKIVQMMHGRVGIHSVEGQGTTVWAEIPLRRAPVPRKAPGFNTTSLLKRGNSTRRMQQHVLRSSMSGVGDARPKRASRTSNGDAKSVRILIAEDNKVNQKVLKRMLETLGYSDISVAWNGEEAVAAMKESWDTFLSTPSVGRFDLVLMDCLMPVMDGWTATEAIRAMEVSMLASAAALSFGNSAYLDVQPTIVLALTANATEEDRNRCSECGMDGFYVKPMARDDINAMMLYWVSKLFADEGSDTSSSNNTPRGADLEEEQEDLHAIES